MVQRESGDDGEIDWFFKEIGGAQPLRGVAVVVIGKGGENDHRCLLMHESGSSEHLQAAVAIAAEPQVGDPLPAAFIKRRIKPGDTGFSNLYVAGDRTNFGLHIGLTVAVIVNIFNVAKEGVLFLWRKVDQTHHTAVTL